MHYIQESKFFAKDTSNKTPDLQLNVVGVVVAGRGGGGLTDVYDPKGPILLSRRGI